MFHWVPLETQDDCYEYNRLIEMRDADIQRGRQITLQNFTLVLKSDTFFQQFLPVKR